MSPFPDVDPNHEWRCPLRELFAHCDDSLKKYIFTFALMLFNFMRGVVVSFFEI